MSSPLNQNTITIQEILNTVNALPEAVEQATPSISVNASGLITATAGTKSSTHQLAFQAAKTITPTTVNQIAVSSGYFTGGSVTVKGDSNLVAGNIKSGVSIFGVSGTYEGSNGSSGGDTSVEDGLITKTLTNYTNDRVSYIASSAFYSCSKLISVSFPACKSIYTSAFYYCSNLTSISFPACTSIGTAAFANCRSLLSVDFPACMAVYYSAFSYCSSLETISLPNVTNIYSSAFRQCFNLKSLYLMSSRLCMLSHSNAFSSTPIGGYLSHTETYGSIYVPASLLTSYKIATNWTYFSSRFVGI